MATQIQIKRGSTTPAGLTVGESAMNTNTNQLYIGGTGGTVLVGGEVTGGVDMGAGSAVSANRIPTQSGVYNYVRNSTVTSFNGLTGAVGGVCAAQANTFTALQSFNAGISASGGITFNGGSAWHSLNDGATSGLDAGLVHGVCGARFLENLQTGLLYGGLISVNAGNTAQVDITAGAGIVVSPGASLTAYPIPVVTPVTWATKTGVTLSGLTSSDETWLAIDSSGNLVQSANSFTDAQYASQIPLGAALHLSRTYIQLVKTYPHVSYAQPEQFDPFIRAFGNLKLSGHEITANGANLLVNRSAGKAYALGRNYKNEPNNPNIVTDTSAAPVTTIYHFYRNGSGAFTTTLSGAIIPGSLDDGTGTLATVTPAKYSIQRLFYLPDQPTLLGVYYGREEYNSIVDAQANIPFEEFSESESTATQGIFCGWLIVQGNATALNNTATAKFVNAGLFRNTSNIGGGGLAIAVIDDLNDVTTTTPSNNQVLRWNSGTAQWVNSDVSSLAVSSFNGATGAVTGASLGANTFTALNTFNAGISASGGTFGRFVTIDAIPFGAGGTASYTPTNQYGLGDDNRTNVAIGRNALSSNIPEYSLSPFTLRGVFNTGVGYQALQNLSGVTNSVTSISNTALGYASLSALKTGNSNLGIGSSALLGLTSGSSNIGIGAAAGQNAFASGNTAADALNNGIYIGVGTRASAPTASGEIVIGYQAVGLGNNTAVIGSNSQTSATIYGTLNAPSGISAAGATFSGSIGFQNAEYIRNTTNGRMDFMPAPAGSTHYGMYMDFTSWEYGTKLGTIRASDSALNAAGFLFEASITIGNNVRTSLGSNSQNGIVLADTGNDTIQLYTSTTSGTNSGAIAIVDLAGQGAANRSPTTVHTNPNLYIYRSGSASANDFLRMEHDGTNANIVTGGVSGIDMEPGSGFVGFSGGISASGGITFSSTMRVAGTATFAGLINSTAGLSGTGITLSGNLSAATKSFVIPHPTKPHMTLQHGSLEGPENGVYVRGRLTGTDTIPLPEYWQGLVDSNSITVTLTEIGNRNHHWIAAVEGYTVTVNSESGAIDCFYTVWGERKDVGKMPVEY